MNIRETLSKLLAGGTLSSAESRAFFEDLLEGLYDDAQIGAALSLIQRRLPTEDEILGGAIAMRRHVTPVPSEGLSGSLIDTCGTGGARKTFNISTLAAIVTAAAAPGAVRVAKHGNRGRSGRGSAELLRELGVNIDATPPVQGRCLREIGLCFCFALRVGQEVALLPIGPPGMVTDEAITRGRITKLMTFDGLNKVETDEVAAGDIAVIAGIEGIEIGRTLTSVEHPERLEGIAVEEPTMSVDFIVNNSPFAGREGKYVTSRQVRDRLFRELERNVALKVEDTDSPDTWAVSGRGELHLGILMETMRREGFEFQVSRPRVITKVGPDGERLEPYEELMADVPEAYIGTVIEMLGPRRAELLEMKNTAQARGAAVTGRGYVELTGYAERFTQRL